MAFYGQWTRTLSMIKDTEDIAWETTAPEDLWILDKLILSRHLGYTCGPVGSPVDKSDYYMVRPCVNAMGLGLGAQKHYIKDSTNHLTPGHFWCEFFEGDHISVDYENGKQVLAVQGHKNTNTYVLTLIIAWHYIALHAYRLHADRLKGKQAYRHTDIGTRIHTQIHTY